MVGSPIKRARRLAAEAAAKEAAATATPHPARAKRITTEVENLKPAKGQLVGGRPMDDEEEERKSLQVRMMVSTNTEITAMADMMGVSATVFRRKYQKELTRGHDYVYAVISQKLVGSAFGGDMRAMLAWLRQFGGWQEVSRKELTGKDGAPISIRSLDGPSLVALMEAIGEKGARRRNRSGTEAPQISYDAEYTDLDAVPGAADEGAEESC